MRATSARRVDRAAAILFTSWLCAAGAVEASLAAATPTRTQLDGSVQRTVGPITSPVFSAGHRRRVVHKQRPDLSALNQPSHAAAPQAAVYTDTALQSFEFAHQLVAVVAALQRLGFSVDVLHLARTPHTSTIQMVDMASDHGLHLNLSALVSAPAKLVGSRLYARQSYAVFVSLGDDRAPPYLGIGDVNIHVCTFPYLPEVNMEPAHLFTLLSYDIVLTPSTYAHSHYLFHTELYLIANVRSGALIPQVFTLPPPHHSSAVLPPSSHAKVNIVLPGHFAHNFGDVHQLAVLLFQSMGDKLHPRTRLVLYGSTGHQGYLEKLQHSVRGSPIDIVTDPSPDSQVEILASARVVWFLQSAEREMLEWRKPEHLDVEWRLYQSMGVTLTTAMRTGALPVVIDDGIHDAVVDRVNGYVLTGTGIADVTKLTLAAFNLTDEEWRRMTGAAAASVSSRHFDTYTSDLGRIIRHARAAQPLRRAMEQVGRTLPVPTTVVPASRKMAVCIELRHHYALRLSVLNVMSRLPSWGLTVFHGLSNKRFVNSVLLDIDGVRTKQLPYTSLTADEHRSLLSSTSFWANIEADTVFLFDAGTVLTGGLDPFLADAGANAPSFDAVDLGRPAKDAGLHAVGLIDVKKARLGGASHKPVRCSFSADGDCYRDSSTSAVAVTTTLYVDDDRLQRVMIADALGLANDSPRGLAWNLYTPHVHAPKTAALYTPYDIIYGGGESYFLQSAASLQSFGYSVDIIVHPENLAKSVDDVMRTARGLRVDLKPAGLRLLHVPHAGDTLALPSPNYAIFYLIGNEKAPKLRGIGLVNFYMCQFPFDLDKTPVPPRVRTLSTYDYVLVNSHFTYAHYSKFTSSLFASMVDADMLVPQVELLHPPVQPFTHVPTRPSTRRHIAVLGRIFWGRQNKGQHVAIAAFKALQGRIPADVRLLIVGNAVPGHDAYIDKLRRKSAGLNVDIIMGQPHDRVLSLLQSSLVQWHMTGADVLTPDPASYEHFGMAIVEGMSLGCLPIVLKRGGVVDIVRDGINGFLAADVNAIADKTAAAYAMSAADLEKMTAAARDAAIEFEPAEFTRKLKVMVDRGFLSRPFKHAILHGAPRFRELTPLAVARAASNVAVLIEPRQHFALRFCTLNVMTHLPRASWGLHVFHGVTNGRFTRSVLADVDGVRYTRLPYGVLTIPQYNDLLKSEAFWTALQAETVLLYQTDSLLLGANIGDFVGRYDYVGAPWHMDNERWSVMRDALPGGVGNGGLSLRTTASALAIIRQHAAASNSTEQEDVFFVRHMKGSGFRLAPRQAAYAFCLEVPCVDLDAVDVPLAVHAAWYYNDEARMAGLLERALPA